MQVSQNITSLAEVEQFEAIVGKGVYGVINQVEYWVGNHSLVHDRSVCSSKIEQTLTELEQAGKTTVVVMTKTQVIGIIAVADSLRASSKQAITELKSLGVATMLLTGDNIITANSIGKSLGIDEVHANLLPEDKMTLVTSFAKRYGKVGMIGDGINDAPALATADVGFAVASGTDVAMESATVGLMRSNLSNLVEALRLSKKTFTKMRQNLFFAFFYSSIVLPVRDMSDNLRRSGRAIQHVRPGRLLAKQRHTDADVEQDRGVTAQHERAIRIRRPPDVADVSARARERRRQVPRAVPHARRTVASRGGDECSVGPPRHDLERARVSDERGEQLRYRFD